MHSSPKVNNVVIVYSAVYSVCDNGPIIGLIIKPIQYNCLVLITVRDKDDKKVNLFFYPQEILCNLGEL